MSLAVGTRVGSYEVVSPLGAGGMGEVYRARDLKLKRDVALKVLPAAVGADAERMARFQREAELLATLNHPHIAHVYGVEEAVVAGAPIQALVMELVEGPDLSQRIANGPVPLDDALPIARQIAEALEAAHDRGIIHRDLKPANIKVRDDGTVKVLDFGLAKAIAPSAGMRPTDAAHPLANSPTLTSPAMTQAGIILGTAAYMSPEQAKGQAATKRSDIWAFGCVLYEMLTGRRAFEGEDISDTLAAVLRGQPDWSRLPAGGPSSIRRLLNRCLAKDPRHRLADMADARLEVIASLEATDELPTQSVAASTGWQVLPWAIAVLAVLASIAFISFAASTRPSTGPTQAVRFDVTPPLGTSLPVDRSLGPAASVPLALSPDGQQLAFVVQTGDGATRLWLRALAQRQPRLLADTDGALAPFWSPDSRSIAFFARGKLKKIDAVTGAMTTLCDLDSFNAGSWGDGVILFAFAGGIAGGGGIARPLFKVSDRGGTPSPATTLLPGEGGHVRPSFLPGGRQFLFRVTPTGGGSGTVFVGSLDSSDRSTVFENTESGNVAYAAGHLLFMRETRLVAQPFDLTRLALRGELRPVAEPVLTSQIIPPVGAFSASQNGVLAFASVPTELGAQLTIVDRRGKAIGTIGEFGDYADVEISHSGQLASVGFRNVGERTRHIWTVDLNRKVPSRLTRGDGDDQKSIWSQDDSRVMFSSSRAGRLDIYQEPLMGGTGSGTPFFADELDRRRERTPTSANDKFVLYRLSANFSGGDPASTSSPAFPAGLWVRPLDEPTTPFPFPAAGSSPSGYSRTQGRFSPDGRWVAYLSNESGRNELYVASFPDGRNLVRVSSDGAGTPRWSRDGSEIFFISRNQLFVVSVQTRKGFAVDGIQSLFPVRVAGPQDSYDVFPGGQRFLFTMQAQEAPATTTPITVELNWATMLGR